MFECAGARVRGARVCASVRECARICASARECARVCANVREYARVCANVREYARVCVSMRGYARVRASTQFSYFSYFSYFHIIEMPLLQERRNFCRNSTVFTLTKRHIFYESKRLCFRFILNVYFTEASRFPVLS